MTRFILIIPLLVILWNQFPLSEVHGLEPSPNHCNRYVFHNESKWPVNVTGCNLPYSTRMQGVFWATLGGVYLFPLDGCIIALTTPDQYCITSNYNYKIGIKGNPNGCDCHYYVDVPGWPTISSYATLVENDVPYYQARITVPVNMTKSFEILEAEISINGLD